ncbi:MAG TPA: ribosome maturation factor RimM [Acidobacteriota bacterium]|jgi:16S rRNA processing protein RimM
MEVSSSPVIVARIVKPHSIHGEVVLASLTDVEGRLENTDHFLLISKDDVVGEVEVESRRFFQGRHVLKFSGISDRNAAEELRGKMLAVEAEEIGTLPPDTFFIHDLIGMKICLQDGSEIGKVKDVLETGGVALLEVGERGEILIPFTEEICREVDAERKVITIDPPEGLLQLNAH